MKIKTRVGKKYMTQKYKKTLHRAKEVGEKPLIVTEDSAQARFGYKSALEAVKAYKQALNWLGGGDRML